MCCGERLREGIESSWAEKNILEEESEMIYGEDGNISESCQRGEYLGRVERWGKRHSRSGDPGFWNDKICPLQEVGRGAVTGPHGWVRSRPGGQVHNIARIW